MIDNEGRPIVCDILFTFDSDETNKSYIVYTDNTRDEDGSLQVYASIYDPEMNDQTLYSIETEKEWKVIETILNTLQEEIRKRRGEAS